MKKLIVSILIISSLAAIIFGISIALQPGETLLGILVILGAAFVGVSAIISGINDTYDLVGKITGKSVPTKNQDVTVVNSPGAIVTKNQIGNNAIYNVSPNFSRQLTDDLKKEIITILNSLGVSNVTIRYEHTSETREFVQVIVKFLNTNGYKVYANGVMQSEIKRNEFSIQRHPSDPSFAKITIGPIL